MVYISEWLPDPGPKNSNQWIELFNSGDVPVDLAGWQIQTTAKKPTALTGRIRPGEYLILRKADLKFSLRKTDGQLALINPKGTIEDFAYFHGQAPRYQSANHISGFTFFGKPTPGAQNTLETTTLIADMNPVGIPLSGTNQPTLLSNTLCSMLIGTGLLLAFIIIFVFTNHHDLSELFFGRH